MTNTDVGKPEEELSEAELVARVQSKFETGSIQSALQELATRKSPRRLEVFRTVLEDPGQASGVKRTVAVELGKERLLGNQELLLRQVEVKDATLFARVVQSLGQIGDEQALARLEHLDRPESAGSAQALEFAKSLLAYRLHLNRNLITPPSDAQLVEVTAGVPFGAVAAESEAVQEALQVVERAVPGVAITGEGAVRLTCQGNELLLLFADETWQPGSLGALTTRSALPFVLLKKGLSLNRYFLEQYFFTQPATDGGDVVLLGVRPSGQLTYVGRVQVSADGFHFTLKSVDSPYAPAIDVEGRYDPIARSLELTKAIASRRIAAKERGAGTPRRALPPFER